MKPQLANMKKTTFFSILFSFFLLVSCNPSYKASTVEYRNYNVQPSGEFKTPLKDIIKPYSDSINKSMNNVLGENEVLLEKNARRNSLGFFMTDAFLFMAKQKFNTEVDVAFMNQGGIRLNELAAGSITKGGIFELMPFDNLMFLQKVSGKQLKQYLDTLAAGGVIVQSGLTLKITNKRAENILVRDQPLDESKEYVISNSDYVINNSELLKSIPVQNIGYLQRDAIIDYVTMITQKGKKVVVENINRVTYAE